MEELIINISEYAYPAQESIKGSDFTANVKNLTDYIISIFRNLSLQYVPSFLNGFLLKIQSDANSDDKRKRYASAVCVSSLIDLFPIDEYISQYKKVVEPLLVPGYKPILHIGAIVVGRLALIIGNSKDLFLHNLVIKCFNDLQVDNAPDVRYAAAVIWSELAKTVPDIFYTLSNFEWIILENLQSGDRIICELLINVIYSLFTSESSSVGSDFLIELQDLLLSTTSKNFSDSLNNDKIIIYFQLLNFLLKIKPYFSKKMVENLLFSKCVSLLRNKNFEITICSIETIIRLFEFKTIKVEKTLYNDIIDVLFGWSKELPLNTLPTFEKILFIFPSYLNETSDSFLGRLPPFLKIQDGPLFVYNLIVSVIASLPPESNIVNYLTFMIKMMPKSNVPLPIYTILSALNNKRPKWTRKFIYFMNQIMYVIRQELISQSSNTLRLNIALLGLIQIPIRDLDDALELNSLIMTLITNKDIQVREKIAETSLHLFTSMPDKIPLNTIIKLVKFALDDTSRSVRLNSVRAFKPMTYKLLSQPDVFPIFSRFAYDESPEVRKEAFLIFASLPSVTGIILRNILLSSLKQISSEKECLTPETIPMWIVFPRLLVAATPWLNIYAEAIFDKFINILDYRFSSLLTSEQALVHMNSAMFSEMDESLIKSISKLYRICPDLIQIKPILSVYIKILKCPVHPRTKIHVLKSLKNLGKVSPIIKINPDIAPVLINIILSSKSHKLVVKAMKVIGATGFTKYQGKPPTYSSFFFRNSLTNQKMIKFYFVSNFVNFLNDEFKSTNIEKNREDLTRAFTIVFKRQPEMITRYLEPFFGNYLKFIHDSTERSPIFFQYLKKIIQRGGHLMMEKAKIIYNAIQRDWQSSGPMTKESSEVFRSLVKATNGQCESILNSLISESFFLLKIPNKSHLYAMEVFELLKTISQLSPSYLSTILSGIAEFLNQSYSPNIQELSLDAIKFMLHYCKINDHLSFIKRCINSILQRSQQRFRDKATYLLNEINSMTRIQSIEFVSPFSKSNQLMTQKQPSTKEIDQLHSFSLNISKFIIHLDLNKIIGADDIAIEKWFYELSNYLLPPSSSELIEAMSNLQNQPEFKFEFSFIQVWNNLELLTQKEIALKIEAIFKYEKLPDFVLIKFANLIEFSVLCEINLGVNIILVAQRCERAHLYDKALFFLETYLLYNQNVENSLSDDFKRSLICMNQIVGRSDDAHSIALRSKDVMTHEIWMKLGEWELALSNFDREKNDDEEDESHDAIDRIICYAALDDWESILKLRDQFERMQVFDQSCVAQYFWTAKSYLNFKDKVDSESVLDSFNMSCGYSVQECVEKAILNLKDDNVAQAYNYVHLGWRYASASISSESKNGNNNEIEKLFFRAQQLYELNNIISMKRNNDFSLLNKSKHIWHERLKYLKTNPIYQKELYKICSLIQNDKEGLELFAFRILQSTYKGRYAPLIPKMTQIFFPDNESDQAKFALICYGKNKQDNSIDQAKEIYNKSNDPILKKLIDEFIGKKIYVDATNPDDLEKSFEYFLKAGSNIKTLIKCNTLLAYVKNESSYAEKVVDLLSDAKIKLTSIHFHVLLVLLSNFDISLEPIINRIGEIDHNVLQSASYTMIMLLDHQSENVKSCVKELLSFLCVHCPQPITYDLINNIQLTGAKDLILQLQSYNPSVSSQMILIARKLTSINNNLYEKWINALRNASDLVRKGDKTEAMKTILRLKHTLEVNGYVSVSKYNKEFLDTYKKTLLQLIERIEKNHSLSVKPKTKEKSNLSVVSNLNLSSSFSLNSSSEMEDVIFLSNSSGEFDIDSTYQLLSQMTKKQASQRVVPVSSFDEEIEKKNDWILDVFGMKGVKISKIYNCLQRQENGFKVSFIGSNGKKYNFSLQSIVSYYNDHNNNDNAEKIDEKGQIDEEPNIPRKIKLSEQFMGLLKSTATTAVNLTNRVIVELSSDVLLIDLMKGHISLYDLVVSYYAAFHNSKENTLTYEMTSYMKNVHKSNNNNKQIGRANSSIIAQQQQRTKRGPERCSSNADFCSSLHQKEKFKELQNSQDYHAIAKAIVVTSRNATSWVQRSSNFSKSFGTLSFLSHVMGELDMSPYSIAFDKYSACVSYTTFFARGKPQPVPFRLTPMIIGALGSGCTMQSTKISAQNSNGLDLPQNIKKITDNDNSNNNDDTDQEKLVIGGPFVSAFAISLRSLRRQKGLFAPCLQFFLQDDSLKKKVVPKKAIERFISKDAAVKDDDDKVFVNDDDINRMFSRIDGEKATIKRDIDALINEATNTNNLIRMPPKWIPWW